MVKGCASTVLLLTLLLGRSAQAGFCGLVHCGDAAPDGATEASQISGRVEIIPGVLAHDCMVDVPGKPFGAYCDENGNFSIRGLPPGNYALRVITDNPEIPPLEVSVGAYHQDRRIYRGLSVWLGTLTLTQPGSVRGRVVRSYEGQDLSGATVDVPEQGLYTRIDADGQYLLNGVAPGERTVVLYLPNGETVSRWTVPRGSQSKRVLVRPRKLVLAEDLN